MTFQISHTSLVEIGFAFFHRKLLFICLRTSSPLSFKSSLYVTEKASYRQELISFFLLLYKWLYFSSDIKATRAGCLMWCRRQKALIFREKSLIFLFFILCGWLFTFWNILCFVRSNGTLKWYSWKYFIVTKAFGRFSLKLKVYWKSHIEYSLENYVSVAECLREVWDTLMTVLKIDWDKISQELWRESFNEELVSWIFWIVKEAWNASNHVCCFPKKSFYNFTCCHTLISMLKALHIKNYFKSYSDKFFKAMFKA